MCSALWSRPNHHFFPPNQIPDMPPNFPLAQGHRHHLGVLPCARHQQQPPCFIQCSLLSLKQIWASGHQKPSRLSGVRTLMCMRGMWVLSVVNNKQNHHIPAAYKQAWPCWMSEVLPWRLHLSGSSAAIMRSLLWPSDPFWFGGGRSVVGYRTLQNFQL